MAIEPQESESPMRLFTTHSYNLLASNGDTVLGKLTAQSKTLLCFAVEENGKTKELYGTRTENGFIFNGHAWGIERPKPTPKQSTWDSIFSDVDRSVLANMLTKSKSERCSIAFKLADGTQMVAILRKSRLGQKRATKPKSEPKLAKSKPKK